MKKGFTLIELLAVIVILAVIAVISTPIIIGVIDDAKKSSYIDSTHGILDAANKMVMSEEVKGTALSTYQIDLTGSTLTYSGKKPTSGTLLIDSLKNLSVTLVYGSYCIEKKFDESVPTIKTKASCTIDQSEINNLTMYHETILNGADPIVVGDLIPVEISSAGVVTKASITNAYYSYAAKKWANAVILLDKGITYNVGDTIPESNIESYFVWIPRFKYQLFNTDSYVNPTTYENRVQTINVVFESRKTTPTAGSTTGEWLTHPAFTSFDVNGIWVGKFETGYKGATTAALAQVNSNDSTKIIIKPNSYSWRSIQVGNASTASLNYKTVLDSHMIKNTEWGAVAYLSQSIYGINGNIRINNNSGYLTGFAKTVEPTCGASMSAQTCNTYGTTSDLTLAYNTTTGVLASTTGNISGIYDMSGGASEYVMGLFFNGSTPYYSNSGMSSLPAAKYYDKYTVSNYSGRILGDATGEMGPFGTYVFDGMGNTVGSWNEDVMYFSSSGSPWFFRSGPYNYGSNAGIFYLARNDGSAQAGYTYRLTLAPQ